jgi:hypothetical protein
LPTLGKGDVLGFHVKPCLLKALVCLGWYEKASMKNQ